MNDKSTELEQVVTILVREEVACGTGMVPVGISNRHVHLNREAMDILFGAGSQLTVKKPLGQPGQYAAEEMVRLEGPKGKIDKVRVLGPFRKDTQVEISVTDSRALGVQAPVRESGKLDGTPGIRLVGPCGSLELKSGVIAALRHIHVTPYLAEKLKLADGDEVSVMIGDKTRGGRMDRVLIRVSDRNSPELHIDVDEANAFGIKNNTMAKIMDRIN